jgi:hypothetical protein
MVGAAAGVITRIIRHYHKTHGVKGMYINWRLLCNDRNAWTNAIHKVVEIHTQSPDWKRVIIAIIITGPI